VLAGGVAVIKNQQLFRAADGATPLLLLYKPSPRLSPAARHAVAPVLVSIPAHPSLLCLTPIQRRTWTALRTVACFGVGIDVGQPMPLVKLQAHKNRKGHPLSGAASCDQIHYETPLASTLLVAAIGRDEANACRRPHRGHGIQACLLAP